MSQLTTRTDYTLFPGKREGSEVVLYAPPHAGWHHSADMAIYNHYRSKGVSRQDVERLIVEYHHKENDTSLAHADSRPLHL